MTLLLQLIAWAIPCGGRDGRKKAAMGARC